MGRVTIIGTKARCMHAVCKNVQKRAGAGQKKAHLRPEFVQPSPQCAGGLGVAKNSLRGLDLHRPRRRPGWSVLTADDRLPSLGRDCGGRKFSLPARLRGVTHHMSHMSTAHVLRPPKLRTPPHVPPKVSCWCKAHRARLGASRGAEGSNAGRGARGDAFGSGSRKRGRKGVAAFALGRGGLRVTLGKRGLPSSIWALKSVKPGPKTTGTVGVADHRKIAN